MDLALGAGQLAFALYGCSLQGWELRLHRQSSKNLEIAVIILGQFFKLEWACDQ